MADLRHRDESSQGYLKGVSYEPLGNSEYIC